MAVIIHQFLRLLLLSVLMFPDANFVCGYEPIERQTTKGTLRGYLYQIDDVMAEVFLGVPFAKPPLGDLRLEVRIARFTCKILL